MVVVGLPKVSLTTKVTRLRSALKGAVGDTKFKMVSSSSKKTSASLLGWKNIHAADNGEIGRKTYCKTCNSLDVEPVTVDADGKLVKREAKACGEFEVTGVVKRDVIPGDFIDSVYYLAQTSKGDSIANLRDSLGDNALVGYMRFSGTADERPVALFSTGYGGVVMASLFFEDEMLSGIPVSEEHSDPKVVDKMLGTVMGLSTFDSNIASMRRREVTVPMEAQKGAKK